MSEQLTANVAGIVSRWLREDADVSAVLGSEVYTVLPKSKTFPMAQVTRTGGAPVMTSPLFLEDVRLQIDVWADRQAEAGSHAEVVRAALARLSGVTFGGATFSRVTLGEMRDAPDISLEPAKPRVIFAVSLRVRTPAG